MSTGTDEFGIPYDETEFPANTDARAFTLSDELRIARAKIAELRDAVIWMSGSEDFATGGRAYAGWLKIRHLTTE